ncbi:hypothetical protein BHS09_02530 [Myxococcus xanthus]|uniref:Uncharacterized protein n=1 Tax=Myxococcus xanthus TaxID=34 RepID=A0AAE6KQE5_MYXXA|nr:hypothetical protein [Myxococcus xanthus]QDE65964.1 hypothetical protein BHS09_02530 [Myxococcus xanthus]QDE73236.1 hypothetical protein BHS08_02530 [Myxococcus xanthus]QDF02076.1 hypothetical protein BHS04_02485 [Myxococcus xanthus]
MLLLLAMLAPIGVQAQTPEAAVVEAVAQDAHASFASTLAMPPADGEAQRAGTSLLGVNLPRFAVASLGGAAGGALLGTGGYLIANLAMCEGRSQGFFSFAALVTGGTIGAGLGLLGGTLLVGHWMAAMALGGACWWAWPSA